MSEQEKSKTETATESKTTNENPGQHQSTEDAVEDKADGNPFRRMRQGAQDSAPKEEEKKKTESSDSKPDVGGYEDKMEKMARLSRQLSEQKKQLEKDRKDFDARKKDSDEGLSFKQKVDQARKVMKDDAARGDRTRFSVIKEILGDDLPVHDLFNELADEVSGIEPPTEKVPNLKEIDELVAAKVKAILDAQKADAQKADADLHQSELKKYTEDMTKVYGSLKDQFPTLTALGEMGMGITGKQIDDYLESFWKKGEEIPTPTQAMEHFEKTFKAKFGPKDDPKKDSDDPTRTGPTGGSISSDMRRGATRVRNRTWGDDGSPVEKNDDGTPKVVTEPHLKISGKDERRKKYLDSQKASN